MTKTPPPTMALTAGSGPLCMQFVPRAAAPTGANLAAMVFGSGTTTPATPAAHTPALQMAAPPLGQTGDIGDVLELWHTDQPVHTGTQGLLHYALTDDVLFGAICIAQTDDGQAPQSPPLLQQASEQVYLAVFAALESLGYPHLLRVWNYLSDINAETGGMERYLQFNIGRQDAFRAKGQPFLANAPAACALGTRSGGLQVYFLAAKVAPLAIENPRQVSAYYYPGQYGPRTPSFSRASLARLQGQRWLFISGTASIVGHQSLHVGDVVAQSHETLRNIQALLDQANVAEGTQAWTLADLHYKVYVRFAADLAAVQAVVDAQLPPAAVRIYLQADVCRAELLMEIDATGCLPADLPS
nr:hypothetical protein [uncultured Albidiferax sp.]